MIVFSTNARKNNHLGSHPFHLCIAHDSRDGNGVLSDASLCLFVCQQRRQIITSVKCNEIWFQIRLCWGWIIIITLTLSLMMKTGMTITCKFLNSTSLQSSGKVFHRQPGEIVATYSATLAHDFKTIPTIMIVMIRIVWWFKRTLFSGIPTKL